MSTGAEVGFRRELESLHSISIEVARLHELPQVLDRALEYCLTLTGSEFGFVGLVQPGDLMMDVAAIRGFEPSDPTFYERFRLIPIRPSIFGVVIRDGRSSISNDVMNDPRKVGQPRGHPAVRTFLGVPLRVGDEVIGMVGVANRSAGYSDDEDRLLSTFANQAAVAIENARLYESQQDLIQKLEMLHHELNEAERERVLGQERARIAADLHDAIEQTIFTVGLRINAELDNPDLRPETVARWIEIRSLVTHAAEAAKRVVFTSLDSRPQGSSLPEALRHYAREVAQSSDFDVEVAVSGDPTQLAPAVESALYRVTQVALINVVRHAKATMALVSLRYTRDSVYLAIQDDGIGAPESVLESYQHSATHLGLNSMRRQIEDVGGQFTVVAADDCGLVVRARVPVQLA